MFGSVEREWISCRSVFQVRDFSNFFKKFKKYLSKFCNGINTAQHSTDSSLHSPSPPNPVFTYLIFSLERDVAHEFGRYQD